MSIDKVEPFSGDAYQSKPSFEIFKYLNKKKKPCLWMTGRLDVIPTYESVIDLDSYVRNYYVNRQVRAMFLGDTYQSKPHLKFSNI